MENRSLKKILVIDDDSDILTIIKYALKKETDLELRFALSGQEGLKEAALFIPDLILLDVMMPQMDGIMTLKKLHEIDSLKNTAVVFFTAKMTPQEVESYMHEGIIDVLTKPFDPLKLKQTLLNMWQKYLKR